MKKKPPKKRKDPQKSEFQVPDDDEFSILMKQSGVLKLDGQEGKIKIEKKRALKSEAIKFEKNAGNPDFLFSSKGEKYTEKPFKKQRIPIKTRKLRPGFAPDMELDLHGYTQKEAISEIEKVIEYCLHKDLDNLLIITGKGLNSRQEGGILRESVWKWLKSSKNELGFRYKWAPGFLGGKGAIIVFFN